MRPSPILLSVVAHGAAVVALVVVPLLAYHDRPDVHVPSMQYVRVQAPRLPTPRIPPRPDERVRAVSNPGATPIDAPAGIAPEPPVTLPAGDRLEGGLEALSEMEVPFDGAVVEPVLPPPPPMPRAPLRVGGRVKAPRRIAYLAPRYPPLAQAARVQGDVLLEAIIGVEGTVEQLRVLRGVPLLDAAALDAVRQWRYTPTLLNGTPVPVVMTVTVSFRLR